jgi:hypothetical protein
VVKSIYEESRIVCMLAAVAFAAKRPSSRASSRGRTRCICSISQGVYLVGFRITSRETCSRVQYVRLFNKRVTFAPNGERIVRLAAYFGK